MEIFEPTYLETANNPKTIIFLCYYHACKLWLFGIVFVKETPFYGDTAIKSDESVKAHRDKIYTKILRVSIFIFVNLKKNMSFNISLNRQSKRCAGFGF